MGAGVGVAEEHRRWGPMVRPAARAVFCMGRIRDEEEEGLGDVGSSSNRLKWSRNSWELHSKCALVHHVWALRNQHFIIQNLLALLYHVPLPFFFNKYSLCS